MAAENKTESLQDRHPIEVAKMTYIGRGYDLINGSGFNKAELKARVFDPGDIPFDDSDISDSTDFFTTSDTKELSTRINASLGIKAKFGAFKMEVNANYEKNHTETEKNIFTYINYSVVKGSELFENCSIRNIKNCLTESFKADINDPFVSPKEIVDCYGTHVLANGVVHGARLTYYITHHTGEITDAMQAKASLTIGIKGFETKAEGEVNQKAKEVTEKSTYKCNQYGGITPVDTLDSVLDPKGITDIFKKWKETVQQNEKCGEGIARVGLLYGIWELVDDENRKFEIQNYIMNHLSEDNESIGNCDKLFKMGIVEIPDVPSGCFFKNEAFVANIKNYIKGIYKLDNVNFKINISGTQDFNGVKCNTFTIETPANFLFDEAVIKPYESLYLKKTEELTKNCIDKIHHCGEPGTW